MKRTKMAKKIARHNSLVDFSLSLFHVFAKGAASQKETFEENKQ